MSVPVSSSALGDPLRVADLVPLRRMLGNDSVVLRIGADGEPEPLGGLPPLFFDPPIRRLLTEDAGPRFRDACTAARTHGHAVVLPVPESGDELMIIPILDDATDDYRHLVCWTRRRDDGHDGVGCNVAATAPRWTELRPTDVTVRYRRRSVAGSTVVDAAPWWALPDGGLLELWPHHAHVTAMGLGHAVMQTLITDAAEAAADHGGGPAVRIVIPAPDLLSGLVPLFHGVVRALGLEPARLVVAVDVEMAVDPDLLPVLVHLRTLGLRIDIVGLDELTRTLHKISDTSSLGARAGSDRSGEAAATQPGPWVVSYGDALDATA